MSTRAADRAQGRSVRTDFRSRPLHAVSTFVRTIIPRYNLRSGRTFNELRDMISKYVDELGSNTDRAIAEIGRFIGRNGKFGTIEHIERHLRTGRQELLWTAPAAREITSDVAVTESDDFLSVDASAGPVTVTLPLVQTRVVPVHVRKADSSSNAVIVAASGGETINGDPTCDITDQYIALRFYRAGTEWGIW